MAFSGRFALLLLLMCSMTPQNVRKTSSVDTAYHTGVNMEEGFDLDYDEILARLELSSDVERRIAAVEKRLETLALTERTMEVMQRVQANLTLELDALKNGRNSASSVSSTDLEEELRRRDSALMEEIRTSNRALFKRLMFCSDDEDENDAADEMVATDRRSGPVAVAASLGAIPKRRALGTAAKQTSGSAESSPSPPTKTAETQVDITDETIFRFVNGSLQEKISAVVEETTRGRISNTIHHFMDKYLQDAVHKSFGDPAISDKTVAKFLGLIRETLEKYVGELLEDRVTEVVKRELKQLQAENENDVVHTEGDAKIECNAAAASSVMLENDSELSANATEFLPLKPAPQSWSDCNLSKVVQSNDCVYYRPFPLAASLQPATMSLSAPCFQTAPLPTNYISPQPSLYISDVMNLPLLPQHKFQ